MAVDEVGVDVGQHRSLESILLGQAEEQLTATKDWLVVGSDAALTKKRQNPRQESRFVSGPFQKWSAGSDGSNDRHRAGTLPGVR
jgi:hypothetical protein